MDYYGIVLSLTWVISQFINHKIQIMKRTLHILGIALLLVGLVVTFTACQSKTADSHLAPATDTTGLAQFQSWKAMNDARQTNEDYT